MYHSLEISYFDSDSYLFDEAKSLFIGLYIFIKFGNKKKVIIDNFLIDIRSVDSLQYFFISIESFCTFNGIILDYLYDNIKDQYFNAFKIRKKIVYFSLKEFKIAIRNFLDDIENSINGNLGISFKRKNNINKIFSAKNKRLDRYKLDWEPYIRKNTYSDCYFPFKSISINYSENYFQFSSRKNELFKKKFNGSFTGYGLLNSESKFIQIANDLYLYRMIKRKKDVENLIKVFNSSICPKNVKIIWLKSDRMLMYFFQILFEKKLIKNPYYIRDIVKNNIFVNKYKVSYKTNNLYNAKNAVLEHIRLKKSKLLGAHIIEKVIIRKESKRFPFY
jgi:hypothetical protein